MLLKEAFCEVAENFYVLEKWEWPYDEVETFQLECVEFVREHPEKTLLILCAHPHCFTLGRGLQKIKNTEIELIDFKPGQRLPYPLFQLKRGGGLTFHYPGQLVVYPILNLTHHRLGVHDLMIKMLAITSGILERELGLKELVIDRELLGLWKKNLLVRKKIASIGLAVSRFNTYHGLALNLVSDESMFAALASLYPCGLPGGDYESVEAALGKKLSSLELEKIRASFLAEFQKALITPSPSQAIIDKQRSSLSIKEEISF